MTDAELLAGIDGLFLSQQVASWLRRVRRLRLSEILDMYYSGRGIPTSAIDSVPAVPPIGNNNQAKRRRLARDAESVQAARFSNRDDLTSACHRRKILELIDREVLREETYNMAQVLQFSRSSLAMSEDTLRASCDASVARFFEVATGLLNRIPSCDQVLLKDARPVVDLTLVLDGSRSEYENLEFFTYDR